MQLVRESHDDVGDSLIDQCHIVPREFGQLEIRQLRLPAAKLAVHTRHKGWFKTAVRYIGATGVDAQSARSMNPDGISSPLPESNDAGDHAMPGVPDRVISTSLGNAWCAGHVASSG